MEERIDPPIHTQYFLSGTATTLILGDILGLAKSLSSLVSLSGNPAYKVVPPERTMFWYKSFLTSISDFVIELLVCLWIPSNSFPINEGSYKTSGHLNL